MTTRSFRLLALATTAVALGTSAWACAEFEKIDGSKVPPVGSASAPPTCEDVCGRLASLCGYAPVGCTETCAAETDGWDDAHRACAGQAPSCSDALSCENEETADEDGGADAEDEDAGDAGEGDAGGEDASDASDASDA